MLTMSFLIFVLCVILACAVVGYIARLLVPPPFLNVALAVIAIIGLLVVLQRSGLLHG